MTKTSAYLPLIPLLQKYIAESTSGKRLQKNGKLISKQTIKNWGSLLVFFTNNLTNYLKTLRQVGDNTNLGKNIQK